MREFSDNQGRVFPLAVTTAAAKRVLKATGVNLMDVDQRIEIGNGQTIPLGIAMHGADILKLVDVLYAICQPMLTEKGLSEDDFTTLLDGQTLLKAQAAFLAEWEAFFVGLKRPESVRLLQASREMFRAAVEKAATIAATVERAALDALQGDLTTPAE